MNKILLQTFLPVLSALLLAGSPSQAADRTDGAEKPNIIFILADDLGMGSVSCYGADKFKTPNIDALAKGGTRFLYAYSSPLCGPSRAEIMTGRYAFHTGMTGNRTGDLLKPSHEIMIPKIMKSAGYVTAQVGKWYQIPLQPSDWGFDEYLRFEGSGKYWNTQKDAKTYTENGKEIPLPNGKYLPDIMNDFIDSFMKRHKDQPFYIHYAMSHVHVEILPTPDSKPGASGNQLYIDNVAYMDKLVGKLVAEVDRLGLRNRTLIIFTSDNGTAAQYSDFATIQGKRLSGQKSTMLEGGSHIPFIANWPGKVPAGKTCADLIDFSDILPTFAALGGAKLPAGVTIDGHSFMPELEGSGGPSRSWVYVELGGMRFVCDTKWKIDNFRELLDLSEAPFKEQLVFNPASVPGAANARQRLYGDLVGLVGPQLATNGTESILTWHNGPAKQKKIEGLDTKKLQKRLLKHQKEQQPTIPTVDPNGKDD